MPTWTKYDVEVQAERSLLAAYGVETLDRRVGIRHAPTYRAQALRELARRLALEEVIARLTEQISALHDRCEAAEELAWALRAQLAEVLRDGTQEESNGIAT